MVTAISTDRMRLSILDEFGKPRRLRLASMTGMNATLQEYQS
jgi:hypothetical protein